MKNISLKFVELHSALFLAGKNFGAKLQPEKITGLFLSFDDAKGRLYVEYNGELSVVPEAACANIIPFDAADFGYSFQGKTTKKAQVVTHVAHPMKSGVTITAQVADPTGSSGQTVK